MVVGTRRRGAKGGGTARGRGRGRGQGDTKSSTIGQQEAQPSEYERQREGRVRENRAKLEALGLRGLASALRNDKPEEGKEDGCGGKRESGRATDKGKGRAGMEEDEDYRPENEGLSSSSSDCERSEEDEGKGPGPTSGRPTPKKKAETPRKRIKSSAAPSRAAAPRKKLSLRDTKPPGVSEPDIIANEEAALQQAIALSLGEANPDPLPAVKYASPIASPRGDPAQVSGKGKRRKQGLQAPPRVQITEDEVGAYFFTFDQAGKGHISVRDLQKMALAHDFCWEDEEMADMIYLFDADGSGKLNYEDFHKILSRCNMVQVSKNP